MREKKFYPVSISFACNDENGNFTGVAMAIDIGTELLSLENKFWNPDKPRFSITIDKIIQRGGFGASKVKGKLRFSRKTFPICGYKQYFGNLIWDGVIMDVDTAKEFISYLHSLDCFTVDCGDTNWFDKFSANKPFEFTEVETKDLQKWGYQKP